MFRPIWSSSSALKSKSKIAAFLSMNTIPNYALFYVPKCCCALVVLGDSSYVLCAGTLSAAISEHGARRRTYYDYVLKRWRKY
jgi:hypothetical protein